VSHYAFETVITGFRGPCRKIEELSEDVSFDLSCESELVVTNTHLLWDSDVVQWQMAAQDDFEVKNLIAEAGCSICYDVWSRPMVCKVAPCGHTLCVECWVGCLQNNMRTCPTCRADGLQWADRHAVGLRPEDCIVDQYETGDGEVIVNSSFAGVAILFKVDPETPLRFFLTEFVDFFGEHDVVIRFKDANIEDFISRSCRDVGIYDGARLHIVARGRGGAKRPRPQVPDAEKIAVLTKRLCGDSRSVQHDEIDKLIAAFNGYRGVIHSLQNDPN
jgi:hypothetical protein